MTQQILTPEHFARVDTEAAAFARAAQIADQCANEKGVVVASVITHEVNESFNALRAAQRNDRFRVGRLALDGYSFLQNGTQPADIAHALRLQRAQGIDRWLSRSGYGMGLAALPLGRLSLAPDIPGGIPRELTLLTDVVTPEPGSCYARHTGSYLMPRDGVVINFLGRSVQERTTTQIQDCITVDDGVAPEPYVFEINSSVSDFGAARTDGVTRIPQLTPLHQR